MIRQTVSSEHRCVQFVPAERGWLALFEESTPDGVEIHAEPVIAWCLGARTDEGAGGAVGFGQAVVGAGPWLDKADPEEVTHFFALVREEQLEPDFAAELRRNGRRSRARIVEMAERNRDARSEGHASWIRDRRTMLRTLRLQRQAAVGA